MAFKNLTHTGENIISDSYIEVYVNWLKPNFRDRTNHDHGWRKYGKESKKDCQRAGEWRGAAKNLEGGGNLDSKVPYGRNVDLPWRQAHQSPSVHQRSWRRFLSTRTPRTWSQVLWWTKSCVLLEASLGSGPSPRWASCPCRQWAQTQVLEQEVKWTWRQRMRRQGEEAILLGFHLTIGEVFFLIYNQWLHLQCVQPGKVSPQTKGACTLQGGVRQPDPLLLGDLTTIKSDEDIQVLCLSRSREFSPKKLREGCKARSF